MTHAIRAALSLAVAMVLAVALNAASQPVSKVPRIAYVWLFNDGPSGPYSEAFNRRMAELGWSDGKNFVGEYRNAHGSTAELDSIMQQLVQSKVDVIVAMCSPEALSAKKYTSTIPIVMAATGDPVAAGLVQSLARPGGNITGVSAMSLPLSAKRIAFLRQMVPTLDQATVIWNPGRPDNKPEVANMMQAASRLGITLASAEARNRDELLRVLSALGSNGTQALLNSGDNLLNSERFAIVERAAALRLPAIYEDRVFVEAGGLMSYGPNFRSQHRRAADYVDMILKGSKPADLPIEQPTRFELVVNKRTAQALGIAIPRAIILQADHVIE